MHRVLLPPEKKRTSLWFTVRMMDKQIGSIGPISIYFHSPSSLQYPQGVWGHWLQGYAGK